MDQHQKSYSFKEKLLLIVLFIAAIICLLIYLKFNTLAFPEHNIKFDITRDQAEQKAAGFLREYGIKTGEYKKSTIFSIDDQTKTYLEREVGVEKTALLAKNNVAVWNFNTRFFKPLQKEEFNVSFLPNGRFAGFQRIIEESAPGASVNKEQAQQIAIKFLQKNTGFNPADWKLMTFETIQRPKRTDQTIIWEKNDFKAKEATYRIQVTLLGDQIGSYDEFLKIPESWQRQYEKETSNNTLTQTIAEAVMYILFGLSMLIVCISKFRRNYLKPKIWWRLAGITICISLLDNLNALPLLIYSYPTTSGWESFLGQLILAGILQSIPVGIIIMIIFTSGEAMYREIFPDKVSLEYLFTKNITGKIINKGIFIGIFTAMILFLYEIVYYFLGKKIGIWTPAEINYSNAYSTLFPWIYPLSVGFLAAVMEEGIFRLYGIPFLKKYVKKTWIAVLITSATWAFLHSNYPQTPWFARGIELTIAGVIFGFIFVRYGITASIIAHYTFNSFQTAVAFFSSQNTYIITSSVIISVLPGIVGFIILLMHWKKGFPIPDGHSLNKSVHIEKQQPGNVTPSPINNEKESYTPLSARKVVLLIFFACVGFIAYLSLNEKVTIQPIPVSITRGEALQAAKNILINRGININEYQNSVVYNNNAIDDQAVSYILEKSVFSELKMIYPSRIPTNAWSVRFFRPLQKEEYVIKILPDGKVYSVSYILDEKSKGANLTKSQAQEIAQKYLINTKQFNFKNYKLVDSKQDKKPNRTDYTFTFEDTSKKINDAAFRSVISVSGNNISQFYQYIKIPEQWIRDREKTTIKEFIIQSLSVIGGIIIFGLIITTFLQNVRNKSINFKLAFQISVYLLIFNVLALLNEIPVFNFDYSTSIPISSFQIEKIITMILGLIINYFTFVLLIGFAASLYQQYNGSFFPQNSNLRPKYFRDSLIIGYTIPFISTGLSVIVSYFYNIANVPLHPGFSNNPDGLDHFFPFITVLSSAPSSIILILIITIVLLTLLKYIKKWQYLVILSIIVIIIQSLYQINTFEDYLFKILQSLFVLLQIYILIALIAHKNIISYLVIACANVFFLGSVYLLNQPRIFLKINGIILLITFLLPLILSFIFMKKKLAA